MPSLQATPHLRRTLTSAIRCLGVGIVVTAVFLLAGCGGGSSTDSTVGADTIAAAPAVTPAANPAPAKTAKTAEQSRESVLKAARERAAAQKKKDAEMPGVGNGAVISFHSKTHDFGVITDTQTYETAYKFVNTGTGTLYINEVQASCGCTVPTLDKKEYEPGENGEIKVVFDPKGKSGRTPKNLTVRSNGARGGTTTLSFTSQINSLLTLEGKFLKFGDLTLNEGFERIYSVRYRDPNLRFESISVNHPYITVRVIEEGVPETGSGREVMYRADIRIEVPKDTPWGSLYACQMKVNVLGRPTAESAPINWQYTVFLQGNIYGNVKCSSISGSGRTMQSAILPIGTISPTGSYEAATRLYHAANKPFKIIETSISDCNLDGVNIRIEPAGPASHRIYISGVTGGFKGKVDGRLNVVTDVPGEGPLAIQIIGTVR